MNKRSFLTLVILLMLIVTYGAFQYFNVDSHMDLPPVLLNPSTAKQVPDGWTTYKSEEWEVSFAYPSTWVIESQFVTEESNKATESNKPIGALLRTIVRGDGYSLILNRDGHGLEDDSGQRIFTPTKYIIDGVEAKSFDRSTTNGYSQFVAVDSLNHYIQFTIVSASSTSKEITDIILSTVALD